MAHESSVLEKVTALRTSWATASSIKEKSNLDSELSGALKTIMAVSENYPDLKANQNFSQLQEELQKNGTVDIKYIIISENGPDHDKSFIAEVRLNDNCLARGVGKTKKEAEMQAAKQALENI